MLNFSESDFWVHDFLDAGLKTPYKRELTRTYTQERIKCLKILSFLFGHSAILRSGLCSDRNRSFL